MAEAIKKFTPKSIDDWRNWLEKNHLKENKVVMIKYKVHTGRPSIKAADAMKEAICFGWIDTTAKRLDEDKYSQIYVKRNGNSRWSNNTIRYGKELFKAGKMSPFGIKIFKEGLKKKTHDHGIPQNPEMPAALKKELDRNPKSIEFFNKIAPSRKKMYYRYILHAKMDETRIKRVHAIIQMCNGGKAIF